MADPHAAPLLDVSDCALLQKGVPIALDCPMSVRAFLEERLGLDHETVEGKIKTILLDGMAVDDLSQTPLYPGATLALSGALPGLAGATLRRGGFFKGLRKEITHRDAGLQAGEKGTVTVKLFNVLVKEIGPTLLYKAETPS